MPRRWGWAAPMALSRACDRATAERPAGAPLFWTLGANQSGKAAIAAWRDMLLPALAGGEPMSASGRSRARSATCWRPGAVALAETYPAEALRHLGIRLKGSKRRQADRAAVADQLAGGDGGSCGRLPDAALAQPLCATASAPTPPARTGSTASWACCAC